MHRIDIIREVINLWPVRWLLYLAILAIALRIFKIELKEVPRFFADMAAEFGALFRGDVNLAALDAGAIVAVSGIGALMLLLDHFSDWLRIIDAIAHEGKAQEFSHSAQPDFLILLVVIIAVASVLLTRPR
jgi:hypothetical protein